MMYAEALFPDRRTACGVTLPPLTLGHALLLRRLDSPFVRGETNYGLDIKVTFNDVLEVAFVVSRPWNIAAQHVNHWRVMWWMRWKWITRRRWIAEDTAALLRWSREQWTVPEAIPTSDGGTPRGAELLHLLVVFCCSHLGCSHAEALSVPVRVALWDYFAHHENEGSMRMVGAVDDRLEQLSLRGANEQGKS